MSKSRCASITSRLLLTIVAELIVTTGPIAQVGCASACSEVTSCSESRLRPRNGPPLAVTTRRRTSSARPPRSACARAECSESTGTIWPGPATALTSGPPATSDSLLASASVEPACRAARVGRRPIEPVMPLSTTSVGRAAASVAASGPTRTFGVIPCSASASRRAGSRAGSATATTSTPNSAAWAASAATSPPPAASTETVNRSRLRRTTSSAWVPMDPVLPRITTSRMGSV